MGMTSLLTNLCPFLQIHVLFNVLQQLCLSLRRHLVTSRVTLILRQHLLWNGLLPCKMLVSVKVIKLTVTSR